MSEASNTGGNTKSKPYPGFPLSWHPRGGWSKKLPGDTNRTYFGKIDPELAMKAYHAELTRREKGEAAAVRHVNLRVREAVNLFLNYLDAQLEAGQISKEQRASYGSELLDWFVPAVGKNRRLSDFCKLTAPEEWFAPLREKAMERGIFAAEKHVIQIRSFLKWCSTIRRFIPAPFYGNSFNPPSDKEKRHTKKADRKSKGVAFWHPAEAREIVEAARTIDIHFHAQVLLMLNGGMGAKDLSDLEDPDVDWDRRCIHTDRSKTLVPRVIPLWDKTIDAMKASRTARAKPRKKEWDSRFFLTKAGRPLVWERLDEESKSNLRTDAVRNRFYALLNGGERTRWKTPAVRLTHLKRHRAGAYTLRSVFTTLSLGHGGDKNLEAIILGQQFERPVLEYYVRDDQRAKLVAVVDHVRLQIWPDQA